MIGITTNIMDNSRPKIPSPRHIPISWKMNTVRNKTLDKFGMTFSLCLRSHTNSFVEQKWIKHYQSTLVIAFPIISYLVNR